MDTPRQYAMRVPDGKGLCGPLVRWNNTQYAVVSLCFSVHYYNLENTKENYKFMLSYPALARLLLASRWNYLEFLVSLIMRIQNLSGPVKEIITFDMKLSHRFRGH